MTQRRVEIRLHTLAHFRLYRLTDFCRKKIIILLLYHTVLIHTEIYVFNIFNLRLRLFNADT